MKSVEKIAHFEMRSEARSYPWEMLNTEKVLSEFWVTIKKKTCVAALGVSWEWWIKSIFHLKSEDFCSVP